MLRLLRLRSSVPISSIKTALDRRYMATLMQLRAATHGRVIPPDNMKIEVTDEENEVFKLLDECTEYLNNEHGLTTSCRVAGGWVRDKVNYSLELSSGINPFTKLYLLHSCWDRTAMILILHWRT